MEVVATIEIDRPAAEVFEYIADMANNPTWQQGQQRCTWTSDPPLRLGSTYDQEARFLGRAIHSSFEVVEFEPGERIRIRSTAGTMPIDVTRTVRSVGEDRSAVEAVVRGDPPGALGWLGPLLKPMVARSVNGDRVVTDHQHGRWIPLAERLAVTRRTRQHVVDTLWQLMVRIVLVQYRQGFVRERRINHRWSRCNQVERVAQHVRQNQRH